MAEDLFIPKLGQTVEEVTIVGWLVDDGVKVEIGMSVLEVETDKAIFPVEANANGYLHKGPFFNGEVLPVLTVIATIGKGSDSFSPKTMDLGSKLAIEAQTMEAALPAQLTGKADSLTKTEERVFISPRAKKLVKEKSLPMSAITPTGGDGARIIEKDVLTYLSGLPKATPVAQKMAAQSGIDLAGKLGSGPKGTITKADVEKLIKVGQIDQADLPVIAASALPGENEAVNLVPIKGVREIIFNRMGTSVHTTARVTIMTEVDATSLVEAREQLKKKVAQEWAFSPGYNDLLAIIVARALREHLYMNARVAADNSAIEWLGKVNMGMAVDTDRGLLVPVIHNADQKGLREFGAEFREKVERARAGRALPDDLTGGTFTITNLGIYDIDAFTPVINLPEAAILGIGRINPKPVVHKGEIVIRHMLVLSLVFDHRLVDGAPAARFLQRIKHLIETPYLLLG